MSKDQRLFGTDGVRGRVGESPITPEMVMHLGYAAGKVLAGTDRRAAGGDPPAVLIGKDTRISGYMLESALQAGLSAAGIDVYLSGTISELATRRSEFGSILKSAGAEALIANLRERTEKLLR